MGGRPLGDRHGSRFSASLRPGAQSYVGSTAEINSSKTCVPGRPQADPGPRRGRARRQLLTNDDERHIAAAPRPDRSLQPVLPPDGGGRKDPYFSLPLAGGLGAKKITDERLIPEGPVPQDVVAVWVGA